jgi:hypothetical protein
MPDIIPDSFQNRYDWLKRLHDDIDQYAAALSWDSGKVSEFKAFLSPMMNAYGAVLTQLAETDAAVGGAAALFETSEAELRRRLGEIRKNAGYNEGIGDALEITSAGSSVDPANIKPSLKAVAQMGHVRLTGRKNHAQTVNIYWRRKSEMNWKILVAKRRTFPFDDQNPLAQPGVAEEREYMARGVIGDNEIGLPSDIVPVLFGG